MKAEEPRSFVGVVRRDGDFFVASAVGGRIFERSPALPVFAYISPETGQVNWAAFAGSPRFATFGRLADYVVVHEFPPSTPE